VIVAAAALAYNARMLATFMAALACVTTPPRALAVDAAAMSMPAEVGPLSSPPLEPLAAGALASQVDARVSQVDGRASQIDSRASQIDSLASQVDARALASHMIESRAAGEELRGEIPWSPSDVECAAAAAVVPDCSALASRFDDDFGSCRLLAGHSRGPILARGRGHGARHVAAGGIRRAAVAVVVESHATQLALAARLTQPPPDFRIVTFALSPSTPPSADGRGIDRPPRA
jgi:hypothetical protein